jgi:KaiC/GvpD/RAD55 family RecA-like ATPase
MLTEDLREKVEKVQQKLHYGNDVSITRGNIKWILEPLIPYQGITIVEGIGGSGKSWFAMELSYAITSGIDFANKFPVKRSGTVLYLTDEEIPEIFVKRLDLISGKYGNHKKFYWLSTLQEDFPYSSFLLQKKYEDIIKTEMVEILEYLINEYKPVLVVLDPLLGFYGLNDDKVEEQLAFYDMLREWIKKYQCSFLLLHLKIGGFRRLKDLAEEIITYENIKFKYGKATKQITIEKANRYSPLLEEFPIRLRWNDGIHIYDGRLVKKVK